MSGMIGSAFEDRARFVKAARLANTLEPLLREQNLRIEALESIRHCDSWWEMVAILADTTPPSDITRGVVIGMLKEREAARAKVSAA